mmetsp:Transcript_2804/g.12035  ORF Transcript_2804/g.12035 Transcript_2804/m.12035 type:complete len:228 (+) Transcript_2804:4936-5619(+)
MRFAMYTVGHPWMISPTSPPKISSPKSSFCLSLRNAKTWTTSYNGFSDGNFFLSFLYCLPRSLNPWPSGLALQLNVSPSPGFSKGMSKRGMRHRPMPSAGASLTSSLIPCSSRIDPISFELGELAHVGSREGIVSSASCHSSSVSPMDSLGARPECAAPFEIRAGRAFEAFLDFSSESRFTTCPAGALSAANFPATKVGPSSSSTVGCLKQQAMSRDSKSTRSAQVF